MNKRKLSALAAVGIVGLGMAGTPVMAADATDEGDVDVTYTIGTVPSNNQLVMVLPADINMFKSQITAERTLKVRYLDNTVALPNAKAMGEEKVDFKIGVKSENEGKFKLSDKVLSDVGHILDVEKPSWLGIGNIREETTIDWTKKVDSTTFSELENNYNKAGSYDRDATNPIYEYVYNLTSKMATLDGTTMKAIADIPADPDAPTTDEKAKMEAEIKKIEKSGQNGEQLKDVLTFKISDVEFKKHG